MDQDPGPLEPRAPMPDAPLEPDGPLAALLGAPETPEFPPTPGPALPPPMTPPFALPPRPVRARQASVWFLVGVTVLSLAADLITKAWAKMRLSGLDPKVHGPKHIDVWKQHVEFIFAQNPGGAWSFLRGLPDSLRRPFFLVVSAAAIVFIVSIYRRVHEEQTAMRWGLPLALGGAMGNLVDRIRYGWVVDFIDVSMRWGGREHHWPTFNVADIAIVVGVALMGLDMAQTRRFQPHEAHTPAISPPVA